MAAKFFVKHLRLDESELPSCDRTPPLTPKTPVPKTPKTPGSPFDLNVNYFCFRKGRSRLSAKMNGTIGPARSVIYQPEGHPKQAVIDGEIWPPIFKPRHVRSAKKMNVEDGDIFIATYPKCGTTWLQHICHQLVRGEQYHPGAGNEMCIQSPMIERMGAQFAGTVMRPRILKTHFTHQNMPWSPKGKYIFCVRNPKDCLTSYYHHNRNFKIYNWAQGDFDTFFDLFLNGQLAFGDYFEHLSTWLPHLEKDNVLFLKYEDMVADLKGCIRQIGEFIGGRAGDIVEDEIRLARIAANSTIDAMKKDQQRWFPEKQLHKSEFIRKGGSRDWKNHLTKEQSDRLDSVWASKMAGTVAEHWWRFEMSWEDAPLSLLSHLNLEDDDMESVSRRGSFSTFDKEHGHLSRFGGADRRCSYTSLISAGYGSVWSLNH